MSVSSDLPLQQPLSLSHTHTVCLTAPLHAKTFTDTQQRWTVRERGMSLIPCLCHMLSDTIAWLQEELVTGSNRSHRCRKVRIRNLCVHIKEEKHASHHVTTRGPDILCHRTGNVAFPKQTCKHTQGTLRTKCMTGSQNEKSSTDIWRKSHFSVTQALHLHCARLEETMICMRK